MNKENKENGIENLGKLIQGASKLLESDQLKNFFDKVELSKGVISDAIKSQFGESKDESLDHRKTNEVHGYDGYQTYATPNSGGSETFTGGKTEPRKVDFTKLAELKIGKFSFSLRKQK